jgi:hypothetical protein
MTEPSKERNESEAREIDREMEIINREGGGTTEAAPLRRLGYLLAVVLVIGVILYLLR